MIIQNGTMYLRLNILQLNQVRIDVPIVVRSSPGGACPSGYHLVSGAVCIKDITPPTKTTPPPPPPSTTPITNATKSFSIPLASASRPILLLPITTKIQQILTMKTTLTQRY